MRVDQHGRVSQLLAAGLTLYGIVLAWRPLDEADSFFHLSLGRAVLHAGARIVPEPTAFGDFTAPAVASEWLWSLFSYVVYQLGGFALLSALGCVLTGLACYSAWRLARHAGAGAHDSWLAGLVGVLAVDSVICRISVRPELALLGLLPWYMLACESYARARGPRRMRLGLWLAGASVAWAQLHASFVLCPAIYACYVVRAPAGAPRSELRSDGLTFALLLAAQLSSPYGIHISELIASHAAGDAPRYIAEMARPTWSMLDPIEAPNVLAYFVLLVLAGAGMLIERRIYVRELALSLLGAALFATANRFIAEAALLAVPCANQGARALAWHFARDPARERHARTGALLRGLVAALACWLLGLTALRVQALHGPLGRLGVAEHAFAMHAAKALSGLPQGTHVFTDYTSSAVVGFLAAGRLRTFVDGRTPLYFDATDFAVAREMGRDPVALHNGLQRYQVRAAVARRDSEVCAQLSKSWSVALVEPLYTTFVEQSKGAGLTALQPCGLGYFAPPACTGGALHQDIARVRAAGAETFARFLEADASVRCDGAPDPALAQLRALEPTARPYQRDFARVMVEALLQRGAFAQASARMLDAIGAGDLGMVTLLQLPAAGELPLSDARAVLTAYLERAGDDADVGVRAALAEICARGGDQACARFQATRAAVRGRYTSALLWLASHHDDPRVRRDAQRWLSLLGHGEPGTVAQPLAGPAR